MNQHRQDGVVHLELHTHDLTEVRALLVAAPGLAISGSARGREQLPGALGRPPGGRRHRRMWPAAAVVAALCPCRRRSADD